MRLRISFERKGSDNHRHYEFYIFGAGKSSEELESIDKEFSEGDCRCLND